MSAPRPKSRAALRAAAVVALLTTACTPATPPQPTPQPAAAAQPGMVRPGAPGEPARAATAADSGTPASRHAAADVQFMQAMFEHHAQALEMTKLVPTHTKNPSIALLARRIDVSQLDEMTMMRGWLQKRNEPVTAKVSHDAVGAHHASMPGMLTAAQLKQLESARDAAFDRLFLTYMIQHHEGALVMVKDLLATDGAVQDAELFQFVSHVDADQRAEIARMRMLLQ